MTDGTLGNHSLGRTFSDLFPGKLPFANAYTGLATEPQWEEAAGSVGPMGVVGIRDSYGVTNGFQISARGYSREEYLEVSYRSAIVDPPWDDESGGPKEQDYRADEPRTP